MTNKQLGVQKVGDTSLVGLTTKIHLACAAAKFALDFKLSAGNNHDAPEGRKLLDRISSSDKHFLLMDRAFDGDETRKKAVERGFIPIVPSKSNRKNPWEYDKRIVQKSQ